LPAGLSAVQWLPGQGILNANTNQPLFISTVSAQYRVTAKDANGCSVSDSLQIQVLQPLPLNLPADESICKGDTIHLALSSTFSNFHWNDGSTAAVRQLTTPGLYNVSATDMNGCMASDSFSIISFFQLPAAILPKNARLCEGGVLTLNARPGMAVYKWNTGAITSRLTVASPGTYIVAMQTTDGCSWSDTATISTISPLPGNFLPGTFTICPYETKSAAPAINFNTYLWSNMATTRSIVISHPGLYWLKVTDNNGCTGNDTLLVTVGTDCINGFWVPSAFSPNKDGKNDVFRAISGAPLEYFILQVYDRFGLLVFETTDLAKGWDGKYKQVEQPIGAYVWKAVYSYDGVKKSKISGTVALLR
jgi:gliding motility-associated-like protein